MSHHQQTVSKQTIMAIIAIALIGFSGILSETSMNVTFPTLMSVYQLPLNSLQWMTTIYLLAVAIMMTTSATLKKKCAGKTPLFYGYRSFYIWHHLGRSDPVLCDHVASPHFSRHWYWSGNASDV